MVERFTGFGGGHGLYATLRALNYLKNTNKDGVEEIDITAIVGVSDDGGSSGQLRENFPIVPPGDLRMALAALCPLESNLSRSGFEFRVEDLLQYRFEPDLISDLAGHAVGNILLTALWSQGYSTVEGLDALGSMLNIQGRVLPASTEPTVISAQVRIGGPDGQSQVNEIVGQVAVAVTAGRVLSISLEPPAPKVSIEVTDAIQQSDFLIFGPGSWFTSVIPHLMTPGILEAISRSGGQKVLVVNLAPQSGETATYVPTDYLNSWLELAPNIPIDVVVADPEFVSEPEQFEKTARELGGVVQWGALSHSPQSHDPYLLAKAFDMVRAMKRGTTWQ